MRWAWFWSLLLLLAISEGVRGASENDVSVSNLSVINASDPGAWNAKGDSLNALQKHKEAIIAYDEAIRLDPENALAWFKLYQNYENAWEGITRVINKSNNCSGSILAFNKAIEPDLY